MDVDPNPDPMLMDVDLDPRDVDPASNEGIARLSDDGSNVSDYDDDDVPDGITKKALAEYILFLRGCTRSTNDDVIQGLQELQNVVVPYVRHFLEKSNDILHAGCGVSLYDYIDVENLIASINCTQGLHSIHNQNKYFREKFNSVVPRRIELGSKFVRCSTSTVGGNQPIKKKSDEFIYVPITEVLQRWLKNETYGKILSPPNEEVEGIIKNYLDGTHYKNHPLKQKPNHKFIKLYYDEVDMCDSAGAKSSSTNKLGMFYWVDEDVSPLYRSQLKHINLAGIVSNPHVNNYGMNAILRHIVDDAQRLQEGIDSPNGEKLNVSVSVLVGDNLAAHQAGGFVGSFSANHPCRTCKASKDQIRVMTKEDSSLLRSAEEHDRQVQEIEAAEGIDKTSLITQYGVKTSSVLNELEGFHVTQSLPPDLTHDDLEGICIVTTRLFLRRICFEQNLVSLEEINDRIANFDYGYSQKSSIPSSITRNQIMDPQMGFKQTASQMSQLVTMLPLIVTEFILEESPELANYIQMLEIMAICNADKIEISFLGYLQKLISKYLSSFQRIYQTHLTPKQHFLVHRPGQIIKYGPLGNYKTIRFEAKHQYFVRIAQSLRTYKNLPLTLANKHQLYQCYHQRKSLERRISTGPKNWTSINELPFKNFFPNVLRLQRTAWVEINGIKYVPQKCMLAVKYNENNLPEFVLLDSIVWKEDKFPIFVCMKVKTVGHNMSLMAYEVQLEKEYTILKIDDLLTPEVFHAHPYRQGLVITIKRALGRLH